MLLEPLTAVSSVDGRYRATTAALAAYFSEYALMQKRIIVECEYLIALSETDGVGIRALSDDEKATLRSLSELSIEDAHTIKKIEREGYEGIPATNHDVKAVEYFIKKKLKHTSLKDVIEWVHFALTSEDVNSVAYGLALRDALEQTMLPSLADIEQQLLNLAERHADSAMLARTHGQPATPTTFGKEMRVFERRLVRQINTLKNSTTLVKWGGPSANYNAQMVALPEVDWLASARDFVERLNVEGGSHAVRLELNEVTTQIEPHDTYAELFDNLRRINTILLDFSQDIWRYISDGWVTQKPKEGEVGSSAMPHKVNPIDFENAEGNFGIANALFEFFSRKLPVSRLQRDLSDSTVERSFGLAFAHSLIGYHALVRGLGKIAVNEDALARALGAHPEVLAEAIQTVLRAAGAEMPYENLKELTRGKEVTMEALGAFIDGLDISEELKNRLKKLSPGTYTGLAGKLARG